MNVRSGAEFTRDAVPDISEIASKYDRDFDKLNVGESIAIDATERNAWQIAKTRYEARTGKTLTIRTLKLSDGGTELRCGRVS